MNSIKKIGKRLLCVILEHQSKALRKKHDFTVVAVTGSVGKTSTKMAIATVLGTEKRVRFQEGNYNDRLTVPLVLFGHVNPSLFDLSAWLKIMLSNQKQIHGEYPYDVVVVELGTDAPGQIAEFAYIKPDIAVVTATTPEHMEFFGTVEAVAREELTVSTFSAITIVNIDDVHQKFLKETVGYMAYGFGAEADYQVASAKTGQGIPQKIALRTPDKNEVRAEINLLGQQGAKVATAAFAVACELGLDPEHAAKSLSLLQAFSGRMKVLKGIKDVTILDDTYNASPAAVAAALDVLYKFDAPQRIAILGTMNELGRTSKQAHQDMGHYCNASLLDLVVTIGADAKKWTAPAARAKGCKVISFDSPYEAGEYVKGYVVRKAVVLAKGSQNRVFAEESLKSLLADEKDQEMLVRQSEYWLNIKKQQFLTPEGE